MELYGIALILAISTGIQNYINKVEEDTLSSYPITIENTTIDMSSMMEAMIGENNSNEEREEGKVYSKDIMNDMISVLSDKVQTNNLVELKKYIEETDNEIKNNANSIQYGYDLTLNLYKENTEDGVVQVNPSTVLETMGMASTNTSSSMMGVSIAQTDVWYEMLDNEELVESQYDLLARTMARSIQ